MTCMVLHLVHRIRELLWGGVIRLEMWNVRFSGTCVSACLALQLWNHVKPQSFLSRAIIPFWKHQIVNRRQEQPSQLECIWNNDQFLETGAFLRNTPFFAHTSFLLFNNFSNFTFRRQRNGKFPFVAVGDMKCRKRWVVCHLYHWTLRKVCCGNLTLHSAWRSAWVDLSQVPCQMST